MSQDAGRTVRCLEALSSLECGHVLLALSCLHFGARYHTEDMTKVPITKVCVAWLLLSARGPIRRSQWHWDLAALQVVSGDVRPGMLAAPCISREQVATRRTRTTQLEVLRPGIRRKALRPRHAIRDAQIANLAGLVMDMKWLHKSRTRAVATRRSCRAAPRRPAVPPIASVTKHADHIAFVFACGQCTLSWTGLSAVKPARTPRCTGAQEDIHRTWACLGWLGRLLDAGRSRGAFLTATARAGGGAGAWGRGGAGRQAVGGELSMEAHRLKGLHTSTSSCALAALDPGPLGDPWAHAIPDPDPGS